MNTKRVDRPMLLSVISLCLIMMLSWGAQGQGWEFTFGGPKEDLARALVKTADGGFLIAGYSESFGTDNDIDVYLIRTDVEGQVIWMRVYDKDFVEQAHDVIQTDDGGFLVVGEARALGSRPNVFLLKVSADGTEQWNREYGNAQFTDRGNSIIRAVDDGYMIVGTTNNTASGEDDILLIKVDNAGNLLWRRSYGSDKDEEGNAIVAFQNGYVLVGAADNERPGAFDKDVIVYRVDAQGNVVWSYRNSSSEREYANDVIATRDGNIVVAGAVNNSSDPFVLKLDPNGRLIWAKAIPAGPRGEEATAIVELRDGSLAITGIMEVSDSNLDVLLAKLTPNGDLIWINNLGDKRRTDYGEDIVITDDGGFAICGYTALGDLAFINDVLLIKTDSLGNRVTNFITGEVFYDKDGACDRDPIDEPLKNWLVRVTGGNKTYFGTTDENGRYRILVDTGRYNVVLIPTVNYWESCISGGYNVNLTNFYDTTRLDFPAFIARACPYLEVDISTPFLAVCSDIKYTVNYCNLGTATAQNAYVEVTLDEKLTYVSSSVPFRSRNDRTYRFDLGNLEISKCGSFTIDTRMACEGIAAGQAALVKAHIYPDTVCLEPGPNWDGSSILVSGECRQDSVVFRIRNVGRNDMTRPSRYYVVQDVIILRQGGTPFQLGAGREEAVSIKSNGATYRMIAEQTPDHPGRSFPTAVVEGCAGDGQLISTGFVIQFPEDDRDNFVDIDAQEILGSIQTVELRGYPKGYQDSLITNNTEITYKIFFKNSGTRTISRVVIRDTLPQSLDVTSLLMGASSHPYQYEVYGNGVLKITLDNVRLLPGGGANQTSNWGFINFRIAQKPNNPTGTVITNRAAIYFDFNAPVMTNRSRHVVGRFPDFLVAADGPVFIPGVVIRIGPNPASEFVTFEMQGRNFGRVIFSVFDMTGRRVDTREFNGNQFVYYRNRNLTAGTYVYKLETEGQLITSGKLMVR